jgi:hypothetical protein
MSSDSLVFNCATCSKIINGRQNFAICFLCQRRVHRVCCDGRFSNNRWAEFRRTFTCSTCRAGMTRSLSRPGDAEDPVPVLASRGQHLNRNYFSDGEQQLVIEESFEKTHDVSTNVPQPAIKYEIKIGSSRKGGDIVIDGRGYTYRVDRDFTGLRVWRCNLRGCNSTLEQITRPGVDILRNYSQEDFTLNAKEEHSHRPNSEINRDWKIKWGEIPRYTPGDVGKN